MKRLAIGVVLGLAVASLAVADELGEMAKLKGQWQLTAMEIRGREMPAESLGPLKQAVLELGDGKLAKRLGNKVFHEGTFKIDARANPKTIEGALLASPAVTSGRGAGSNSKSDKGAIGIYEIDGDTLRICFGAPGSGKPPKAFKTTGEGGGSTLNTYRRVK